MGGACGTVGDRTGTYTALVGKSEENRPLGRPKNRWDDNIEMYLQGVGGVHVLNRSCAG